MTLLFHHIHLSNPNTDALSVGLGGLKRDKRHDGTMDKLDWDIRHF